MPVARERDGLGRALAHLQGEGDLVRELDDAAAALGVPVGDDEVEQRVERADLGDGLRHRGVGRALGPRTGGHVGQVRDRREALGQRADRLGVRDVVGDRAREPEHEGRDAVDARLQAHEPGVAVLDDDAASELPGRRVADDVRIRLAADRERVLAGEGAREGVVGGDDGQLPEVIVPAVRAARRPGCRRRRGRAQPRLGERVQPPADALGEGGGGLAGEGEAEHVLRRDEPVGDEPRHPRGHGLGLAAAGAGDDEGRPQRRLDHGALLRRRLRHAEPAGELDGVDPHAPAHDVDAHDVAAHDVTARTTWTRQTPCRYWSRQWLPTLASNTAPAIPSATAPTRRRKASTPSSS